MIVVRDTFRIRFGQMKDALASMKQLPALVKASGEDFSPRVLTDATGPFYTLVLEMTFEDLATYESKMKTIFGVPEWKEWYGSFVPFITDGEREIYTVVPLS